MLHDHKDNLQSHIIVYVVICSKYLIKLHNKMKDEITVALRHLKIIESKGDAESNATRDEAKEEKGESKKRRASSTINVLNLMGKGIFTARWQPRCKGYPGVAEQRRRTTRTFQTGGPDVKKPRRRRRRTTERPWGRFILQRG